MSIRIGVVVGTTRPGRKALAVAQWAIDQLSHRGDAQFELVDIADFGLPVLDEPRPAGSGHYTHEHTKAWARAIAPFDGYIWVTPEYNHSLPGSFKNALDFIHGEWVDKSVGFITYGAVGGARCAETLRLIAAQFSMADVRAQVMLFLDDDFDGNLPTPRPRAMKSLNSLADQVVRWAAALQPLREAKNRE